MAEIRVGIIGCGRMGAIHARILGDIPGVAVHGVADRDVTRAEQLAATIPDSIVSDDAEALIREARLDVVHVLTPPTTHALLCCTAMEAGCHVFVEKPMAMSSEEAIHMAAVAKQHDRLLTVDHNNRFDPIIERAQQRIQAGRIGELVGVDIFHNSLPPEAPWVSMLPSGDWFNDFDHLFYLSDYFLGTVHSVKAVGMPGGDGRVAELHVAARNERGWSGLTYSTLTSPFEILLTLRGTQGTIDVDILPGTIIERHPSNLHRWLRKGVMNLDVATQLVMQTAVNSVRVLSGREKGWGGLRTLLAQYYQAIKNNSPSPVAMETGLRIVELKADILRQLEA